jgi:hypothetical protein
MTGSAKSSTALLVRITILLVVVAGLAQAQNLPNYTNFPRIALVAGKILQLNSMAGSTSVTKLGEQAEVLPVVSASNEACVASS